MPPTTEVVSTYRLIGDGEVAKLLSMSRSWVRKQRHLKRRELPHVFNIDPVMIGSSPRYRLDDVIAWIEALGISGRVARGGS